MLIIGIFANTTRSGTLKVSFVFITKLILFNFTNYFDLRSIKSYKRLVRICRSRTTYRVAYLRLRQSVTVVWDVSSCPVRKRMWPRQLEAPGRSWEFSIWPQRRLEHFFNANEFWCSLKLERLPRILKKAPIAPIALIAPIAPSPRNYWWKTWIYLKKHP